MTNKISNQHWVPKFILKKWLDESNEIKYIDIKTNEIFTMEYIKRENKFRNDPFTEKFFYEDKSKDENFIENKLSKIETEFAHLINLKFSPKILKNDEKVIINRKDLELIKIFLNISCVRNKPLRETAKNLDGDEDFNKIWKDKSLDEIDMHLNNKIEDAINFYFEKIKNPELSSLHQKCKYSNEEIFDNSWSRMDKSALKIFYSESGKFIFTDSINSQIMFEFFQPLKPVVLISIFCFSPNLIFAFLPTNAFFKEKQNYAKNFIHELAINYTTTTLKLPKDFFTYNTIHNYKYKNNKKIDWNDEFFLKVNELSDDNCITINAFFLGQALKYICFKDKKDFLNSKNLMKTLDITKAE